MKYLFNTVSGYNKNVKTHISDGQFSLKIIAKRCEITLNEVFHVKHNIVAFFI